MGLIDLYILLTYFTILNEANGTSKMAVLQASESRKPFPNSKFTYLGGIYTKNCRAIHHVKLHVHLFYANPAKSNVTTKLFFSFKLDVVLHTEYTESGRFCIMATRQS